MTKNDKATQTREKLLDAAFEEVYINGYHGASTAAILKKAHVPKGSMYHFFPSKKELILAVIQERIFPRMDVFFDFSYQQNAPIIDTIETIFKKMSEHTLLIQNGCPMHRLMVEMAPLDKDFNELLNKHFEKFTSQLNSLLLKGIEHKTFDPFNTQDLSRFIITSTWGVLSLSPSLSSKKDFEAHYSFILDLLKSKSTD